MFPQSREALGALGDEVLLSVLLKASLGCLLNGVKALETWWRSVLCGPGTVPWPSVSDTGLEVCSLAGATGAEAGDEPRPGLGLHVALVSVCVCVCVSLQK